MIRGVDTGPQPPGKQETQVRQTTLAQLAGGLIGLGLCVSACPAGAQSLSAYYDYQVPGGTLVTANVPPPSGGSLVAGNLATGQFYVRDFALLSGGAALFGSDSTVLQGSTEADGGAQTDFTYLVGGTTAHQVLFHYTVGPGGLTLAAAAGADPTTVLTAFETAAIYETVNGMGPPTQEWRYSAAMMMPSPRSVPTFSQKINGAGVANPFNTTVSNFTAGSAAYAWSGGGYSLDLGMFNPGDTIDVSYAVTTQSIAAGCGFTVSGAEEPCGLAFARYNDPVPDGSEMPDILSASFSLAPEPGSLAVLVVGLVGLGGLRRSSAVFGGRR